MIKRKPHVNKKTLLTMKERAPHGLAFLLGEVGSGEVHRAIYPDGAPLNRRAAAVYNAIAAVRAMVLADKLRITYEFKD